MDTPTQDAALTTSALKKLERDLDRLKKAGARMEAQIAQSAEVRSGLPPTTRIASMIVLPVPVKQTFSPPPPPTAVALRSSIVSIGVPAAVPINSAFTKVKANAANAANATSAELVKQTKSTVSTLVPPAVTLTLPTPNALTPSTSPKPVMARAAPVLTATNRSKSTAKPTFPKGSGNSRCGGGGGGVVRNLILQYETPSTSSSTSDHSERSERLISRRKQSAATSKVLTAGTGAAAAKSSPAEQIVKSIAPAKTTTTVTSGLARAPFSFPRKDASPDLGNKHGMFGLSAFAIFIPKAEPSPKFHRSIHDATEWIHKMRMVHFHPFRFPNSPFSCPLFFLFVCLFLVRHRPFDRPKH